MYSKPVSSSPLISSGFFGLENYVVENHVEFIFSIRRGLGFWGIWIYVEKQFEMTPESFFS
jgi:hypothetical protein